jgi:DNA-binding GntR family transcriptional regulator
MRVQLEIYALQRVSSHHFKDYLSDWEKIIRLMARAAEDKDEQAILSLDADFHQRLLIAAGIEDFIPLWLAIYGRMRGHHRQSNRRLDDLSYVPFVHERLLQSFLTKDIESSSKDLQSHLENTDFNRKAQAVWAKRKQKESK